MSEGKCGHEEMVFIRCLVCEIEHRNRLLSEAVKLAQKIEACDADGPTRQCHHTHDAKALLSRIKDTEGKAT